jgi:Fe-S-cluster-containing hydrogenase component 2
MDAITISGEGIAQVNMERCIGCGLCVTACSTKSIILNPKMTKRIPPASSGEQMMQIAKDRGII